MKWLKNRFIHWVEKLVRKAAREECVRLDIRIDKLPQKPDDWDFNGQIRRVIYQEMENYTANQKEEVRYRATTDTADALKEFITEGVKQGCKDEAFIDEIIKRIKLKQL